VTNLIEDIDAAARSAPFRKMADRVDLNAQEGFAGAFVVVPPEGDPVELLLLNNQKSPAMFWSLLKTTAEMQIAELEEKQRVAQSGYGRY